VNVDIHEQVLGYPRSTFIVWGKHGVAPQFFGLQGPRSIPLSLIALRSRYSYPGKNAEMTGPICWRQHARCLRATCKIRSRQPLIGCQVQKRGVATYTSPFQAKQISVLQSTVDKNSKIFQDNAKSMSELCDKFSSLHNEASLGGSAKAREKHIARGKMLVRE